MTASRLCQLVLVTDISMPVPVWGWHWWLHDVGTWLHDVGTRRHGVGTQWNDVGTRQHNVAPNNMMWHSAAWCWHMAAWCWHPATQCWHPVTWCWHHGEDVAPQQWYCDTAAQVMWCDLIIYVIHIIAHSNPWQYPCHLIKSISQQTQQLEMYMTTQNIQAHFYYPTQNTAIHMIRQASRWAAYPVRSSLIVYMSSTMDTIQACRWAMVESCGSAHPN